MRKLTVSREEAKKMGFTHEGTVYGFPSYLLDLGSDGRSHNWRYMPKIPCLLKVVEFLDQTFESICGVFWMIDDSIVFKTPYSVKGPL